MASACVPHDGPIVTRAAAKAAGATRYFTGKPCPHGHVTERWTASGRCDGCQRVDAARRWAENTHGHRDRRTAQTKAWQKANKEKYHGYAKRWTDANPERVKAYQKSWRVANKEKQRATTKAWRLANRERFDQVANEWREANRTAVRCMWRNRRARVRNADGKHTTDQIHELLQKQRNKCASCRTSLKTGYHADHIVPLARGGTNDIGNIQLLCVSCNLSKGHSDPVAWAQKNGRLL